MRHVIPVTIQGIGRNYELLKFSRTEAPTESISPGDMNTREEESIVLSNIFGIGRIDAIFPEYGILPYAFLTPDGVGNYTTANGQEEFVKLDSEMAGLWTPPPWIRPYFDEIRAANPKTFRLDQTVTCLRGLEIGNGHITLRVGPGKYSDSFYSNGSEGAPLPSRQETLRRIVWEDYAGVPPLNTQAYNNSIGNAAMALTRDRYFVFVLRGKTVSVNKGVNCTASGAMRWDINALARSIQLHLGQEMARETNDELGLAGGTLIAAARERIWLELGIAHDEYELVPVGFIRELPRGGKPEIMFLLHFSGTLRELVEKVNANANPEKQEVLGIFAQHMNETDAMLRDEQSRHFIQHKGRVNLLLANQYLQNNRA